MARSLISEQKSLAAILEKLVARQWLPQALRRGAPETSRIGQADQVSDQRNNSTSANTLTESASWPARVRKALRTLAKSVVPRRVVREVRQYRGFKRIERPLYLKIRMMDAFGLRKNTKPENLSAVRSIVFVCFGNIMRSAMCEVLMKENLLGLPQIEIAVSSAGLNATPGREAHPWGVASAPQFGVSLENHRARLLTSDMVDQADIIFAMDYQNQVELLTRYPNAADKVFMLSAYAGRDYPFVEIRDPYYGDEEETRRCYGVLQTCVNNLAAALASSNPESQSIKKKIATVESGKTSN